MNLLILVLFSLNIILAVEAAIRFRSTDGPLGRMTPSKDAKQPQWHTITQRVDHFNPSDNRTWSMRYISNDQFFEDSGPIFVMIGGEWEIHPFGLTGGHMFEIAAQHRGMMFYTEHRYYGESFPFKNLNVENLKYLSADQALIDLMYFIRNMKETNASLANSKVVVVGGSYAGTLATWARLKYPHIVDIAYASSAPLHAVADFYEYMEVVSYQIGLQSQECLNTISEAISQLEDKLKTENGIDEMTERFRMCRKIRTDEPYRSHFFAYINAKFHGLVQYETPDKIQDMCKQLLSYDGTSLDKLISLINSNRFIQHSSPASVLYENWHDYSNNILDKLISYKHCVPDYDEFIEIFSSDGNKSKILDKMWFYQICTEFGWHQTTTSKNQAFGNHYGVQFFNSWCTHTFGQNFNEQMVEDGIYRTNLLYGSTKPEITKLISVHGTMDPWHPKGILEDLNPLAPAILINGTSHCADLHPLTCDSPPQLIHARETVRELISKWLQ